MIYIFMVLFLMATPPCSSMDTYPHGERGGDDSLHRRIKNSEMGQKTFNNALYRAGETALKKIAIIDTGFYLEHEQLEMRWAEGYNALDGSSHVGMYSKNYQETPGREIESGRTHGTHMASLVAEITKDCPEIKIVPIKIGMEPLADLMVHIRAFNYIAKRPDIAVVSVAVNYPIIFHAEPDTFLAFKEALLGMIDSGKLLVLAGLNDAKAYIKESQFSQFVLSREAKGRVIVVGASKKISTGDEIIAGFSNRAGTLAPHFVVTAGDNLRCATYTSGSDIKEKRQSYERASGSSHATAVAAGSLIYLMNQFLDLSIDDFPKIIFESASRKPEFLPFERAREIYGHGVLDLDNARLLAATIRVHKRAESKGMTASSSSISHQGPLAQNKMKGENSSTLLSSWGKCRPFEGKGESLVKKWVSNELVTEVRDGKEVKSPMAIHIPDDILPDALFTASIADRHLRVLYTPQPSRALPLLTKDILPVDEGGLEKGVDGYATSYNLLLNKDGKMAFVCTGLQ